ncbi:hypothetical protein [Rhodoblastus sphagnicola]|uniref:hypothetical protein n=1 Tax=Rhodoblastus sphagnicola TaxID=333368 RepID=UPI001304D63A
MEVGHSGGKSSGTIQIFNWADRRAARPHAGQIMAIGCMEMPGFRQCFPQRGVFFTHRRQSQTQLMDIVQRRCIPR